MFVFFETEDGTTGVAPAEIREGDLMCRFYACDIVFVLRYSGHNLVTVLGLATLLERTSRSKTPGTDATLQDWADSTNYFPYPVKFMEYETWSINQETVLSLDILMFQQLTHFRGK